MFILRKIITKNDSRESNQIIGYEYSIVDKHSKDWDHLIKIWDIYKDKIYSFIVCQNGTEIIPLYKDQNNFIMTSDGKTFSNITNKEK